MSSKTKNRALSKKDRFLALVQEEGDFVRIEVFGDGERVGREVVDRLAKELADNLQTFLRLVPRHKRRCVVCGRDPLKVDKYNFAFGFLGHFEEVVGFLCRDHLR